MENFMGVPFVNIQVVKESPQPISKEQWDQLRIEHLTSYMVRCCKNNEPIDPKILNEYNSLIKK